MGGGAGCMKSVNVGVSLGSYFALGSSCIDLCSLSSMKLQLSSHTCSTSSYSYDALPKHTGSSNHRLSPLRL